MAFDFVLNIIVAHCVSHLRLILSFLGLCLIHLKSVALLVREAQCCSSSDESDSSLSSRGSSSIAEEDREMKMIEKNVVELLIKLRFWINGKFQLISNKTEHIISNSNMGFLKKI